MDTLQFDPELYDTIRRNIKRYRIEKGLTSAHLAELVGLSHDFIRQIESPKVRNNFSVDTFYRISVALGTGMDKLAEKTETQETSRFPGFFTLFYVAPLRNVLGNPIHIFVPLHDAQQVTVPILHLQAHTKGEKGRCGAGLHAGYVLHLDFPAHSRGPHQAGGQKGDPLVGKVRFAGDLTLHIGRAHV